jgi:hypothetical protein
MSKNHHCLALARSSQRRFICAGAMPSFMTPERRTSRPLPYDGVTRIFAGLMKNLNADKNILCEINKIRHQA